MMGSKRGHAFSDEWAWGHSQIVAQNSSATSAGSVADHAVFGEARRRRQEFLMLRASGGTGASFTDGVPGCPDCVAYLRASQAGGVIVGSGHGVLGCPECAAHQRELGAGSRRAERPVVGHDGSHGGGAGVALEQSHRSEGRSPRMMTKTTVEANMQRVATAVRRGQRSVTSAQVAAAYGVHGGSGAAPRVTEVDAQALYGSRSVRRATTTTTSTRRYTHTRSATVITRDVRPPRSFLQPTPQPQLREFRVR